MKTLVEYFNELNPNQESVISNLEDNKMKPLKIVAPQNEVEEALWNTKDDKWSRNAKHPITGTDLEPPNYIWEKGDFAIYEGQQVEIIVAQGAKSTVGISLNGRTKMVKGDKLSPLNEGVLGGLTQLSPLNRIMQLAGLAMEVKEDEVSEPQTITEDDSTNMFTQLFRANLNGEYRNNPQAARVATIGQILEGLSNQTANLQGAVSQDIMTKITAALGLGPALLQFAKSMTQEPTT